MKQGKPLAVIIHGAVPDNAPPDEQDTLLITEAVASELQQMGFSVRLLPITLNLEATQVALSRLNPDIVFNLVDTIDGKSRYAHLAPMLLESMGLPYTGCTAESFFLTTQKILAKQMMLQAGIPTPSFLSADHFGKRIRHPYIVKCVDEDASIGIDKNSVVTSHAQLQHVVHDRRMRYGGEWFAERFIEGREIYYSTLAGPYGMEPMPCSEIRFVNFPKGQPEIFDYNAKWTEGSAEYEAAHPSYVFSDEDQPILDSIRAISKRCTHLFNLKGYARIDFRVDANGKPWVLEINPNPCLQGEAGFSQTCRKTGLDFTGLIRRIVADGIVRTGRPTPSVLHEQLITEIHVELA